MEINISKMFSAFLLKEELTVMDNADLEKYGYEIKNKETGVVKSNYHAWQSDVLTAPSQQINLLINNILERLNASKSILGFREDTHIYMNNIWMNINPKASFNRPHIHADSTFSGVYYVKCNDKSGNLCFKHPSMAHQFIIKEETVDQYTDDLASHWTIYPKAGTLVIFPAWLEHYVEPNTSDEDRISIAFNVAIDKIQNIKE